MDDSMYLTLGIALVALGLLLVAADLFVASGVLFALSLASVATGLVFLFKASTSAGAIGLVVVFVGGPVLTTLLLKVSPLRRLVHRPPEEDDPEAGPPGLGPDLSLLRGRIGRTISDLRPGGAVDFDGRRVDGLTEGMMVAPGQRVRCIDVRGGQVIVRPVADADIEGLEITDLS